MSEKSEDWRNLLTNNIMLTFYGKGIQEEFQTKDERGVVGVCV